MPEPLVEAEPTVEQKRDDRDGDGFFSGGGRGAILDQLEHLATWGRSTIALTAPFGAGKTTLIDRILSHLRVRDRTNIVQPPVGFLSNGEELLRHLLAGLSARPSESADLATLKALVVQHAEADAASDRATLLVLDDAHELSVEVLKTVAEVVDAAKDSRAICVLLAGEPSLMAHLEKAVGAKNRPHEIKLKPFSLNDVKAFLAEKRSDVARLDSTVLQSITRRSQGWPAAVLAEADKEIAKLDRKRGFPLVHLIWTSALLAGLVVLVLMQDKKAAPRATETIALPGQTPTTPTTAPVAQLPESDRVPVSVVQPNATSASPSTVTTSAQGPTPPPTEKPAPPLRVNADTEWARTQPRERFTVQLLGVSALASVRQFVAAHSSADLKVVRTQRGGQDWYLVVSGSFSSRAQAQAELPNLPGGEGTTPWIRTFEGIQTDLP